MYIQILIFSLLTRLSVHTRSDLDFVRKSEAHTVDDEGFLFPSMMECYVTTVVPHEAFTLITSGQVNVCAKV